VIDNSICATESWSEMHLKWKYSDSSIDVDSFPMCYGQNLKIRREIPFSCTRKKEGRETGLNHKRTPSSFEFRVASQSLYCLTCVINSNKISVSLR